MTALTRPVTREVATLSGSPLIVTLAPEGVVFREKRRRTSYLLPYRDVADALEVAASPSIVLLACVRNMKNTAREALRATGVTEES